MAKIWYAVVAGDDDNDWGYGSYDPTDAREKAERLSDSAYIVVVREGDDPVAIEEIRRDDFAWSDGFKCF